VCDKLNEIWGEKRPLPEPPRTYQNLTKIFILNKSY
jgi:hypothetical protein